MLVRAIEFVGFLKTSSIATNQELVMDELWLVGEKSKTSFVYARAISQNALELVISQQFKQDMISFWEDQCHSDAEKLDL